MSQREDKRQQFAPQGENRKGKKSLFIGALMILALAMTGGWFMLNQTSSSHATVTASYCQFWCMGSSDVPV
jgi:hypothetical protein